MTTENKKRRESCQNCKYWLNSDIREKTGLCRRYPPVPYTDISHLLRATFPITRRHNWCGEWRKISG